LETYCKLIIAQWVDWMSADLGNEPDQRQGAFYRGSPLRIGIVTSMRKLVFADYNRFE
jgi:hypothetical protein